MADSPTIDWTCEALEAATDLDRLQARGTLRIALKEAGLDARSVDSRQMDTVLRRVLPAELRARGVTDGESVCNGIATALAGAGLAAGETEEAPEDVFRRLAGS